MEIAFDNEKYLKIQKEKIEERIRMFDNKLYLEFGGKIFDDYNASRVLPGFSPDAKIMLILSILYLFSLQRPSIHIFANYICKERINH